MNDEEPPRSAAARRAAELALVRVVHHYGRETLHSDKAIANWAPVTTATARLRAAAAGPQGRRSIRRTQDRALRL